MRLLLVVLLALGCGTPPPTSAPPPPFTPRFPITLECVSSSTVAAEVAVSIALSEAPAGGRSVTVAPGGRLFLGEFAQAGAGERVEVQATLPSTGATASFGMAVPAEPLACVVRIVDAYGMPFPSVGCTARPPL